MHMVILLWAGVPLAQFGPAAFGYLSRKAHRSGQGKAVTLVPGGDSQLSCIVARRRGSPSTATASRDAVPSPTVPAHWVGGPVSMIEGNDPLAVALNDVAARAIPRSLTEVAWLR